MKLKEVINIEILQKIQDGFSETFELPSIIYDVDGKAITEPSNFTKFCKFVRSTEKGNSNCEKFDALLIQEVKGIKKPIFRKGCALKNIITVTIPIIVNNQHIANFGIGQAIEDDFNFDEIKSYAKEINVEEEKLLEAAKTLVPVKGSDLEKSAKFLNTISEQISYLVTQNIQNLELIKKQKAIEIKLQNQNAELEKAKKKAEESDQLKTEFIHNMSHEIRTPLNGILGFSQFLDSPDLTEKKRKQYVNIINNSSNQLLRIIDDILEISQLRTKQVKLNEKEICLNDLLLELFSIFDIKAKENKIPLYLNKGLSDNESVILTDKIKLNKILSNLLENALKFTMEGFIEFGYQLKDSELEIYVKDTGIGIKQKSQKIIFKRFSQEEKSLSENVGGLGLGLSIAKENAELLGGKITLKSKKGEGAIFFVTIPYKLVISNTEKIKIDNEKENAGEKQEKYTILIVEDEDVNYLYLDILLGKFELNFETLHAKHGKEAVEMCKKNDEIDFVLMDMKMPIMNGFEATKLIKEFRPDLPIVAQTAYSTNDEQKQAFSVGCDDFISKPINKENLKEIMNKYLIMKE